LIWHRAAPPRPPRGGLGLELLALALVVGRLGAGVAAQQFGRALELELGIGERRLGGIALRRLLVDRAW
jgi:hypothetical protein